MKRALILSALMLSNSNAFATDDLKMKEGANYCHEKEAVESVNGLLERNPKDPLIIRLVALRRGVCQLIDEQKISLEQGIEIFDDEKNRAVVERSSEELKKAPKIDL